MGKPKYNEMELVIFLVIVGLLWQLIGKIIDYFSDKKSAKKYAAIVIEKKSRENYFDRNRRLKNIKSPNTIINHYPILGYPKNEKIHNYDIKLYYIKPEFKTTEMYAFEVVKGAVENYFLPYLLKYFNQEFITNNKYRISISNNYYVPDFAYMDIQKNILIDIEIDEPYTFKQKQIIHNGNSDSTRDLYFQRAGWTVIRFSEKQVSEQPKSCCRFIAEYLAYATLDNSYLADLNEIPALRHDKKWTYEEAIYYASTDYRKEYLNNIRVSP